MVKALVTVILGVSSLAQAKPPMGFLSHRAKECAATAEIARQSTFRILLPTVEQVSVKSLFGRDSEALRKTLITTINSRPPTVPSADDINRWQLENCLKSKSADCGISKTYTSASMVLVGEGAEAVTAFHNLKTLLNSYIANWKRQGFSALTIAQTLNRSYLPIFVYNYEGKRVANPEDLSVQISGITPEQIEIASRNLDSNDFHSAFDRVTLKLSRSLGKGVKVASKVPRPGETVHLFGYPMVTSDRKNYSLPDSDGSSFYCSVGQVITPEEASRRTNWKLSDLSPMEEMLYRTETIFATNDAVGGNSGGPLFNSDGELVGVLSRGNNKPLSSVATSKVVVPKTATSIATNP